MTPLSAALTRTWPRSQEVPVEERQSTRIAAEEYAHHALAVRRYAYALVGNIPEAEDIAQECFVRLMQTIDRGTAIERVLPWLLRVAHNLSLDALARRPREVALEASAAEFLTDEALSPEAEMVRQERQYHVDQALSRLSAQELRCWTLRSEGLRYREIADVLNVQVGTVATFLVRAAEKLSSR